MRRMLRKLRTALTGRGTMGVASLPSAAPAGLTEILETLDDGLLVTDLSLTIVQWNAAMERLSGLPRASAIGRNADRLLPLFDAIGLPRCLRQAVGGEARFSAEAPGHDGGATIRIEARCVPLTDRYGHVAGVAAFLVDATERQRRAVFARAMETIGRSLASSLDLNEVLDTIANTAMEVMAAQSALVTSWDGKAREFRVLRAVGRLSAEYANRGSIPSGGGPISRAVLESRTVTTPNILTDADVWLIADRRAQIEREGFKAVAAAPLLSKQRVHGALAVHYWTERTFTEAEVHALSLMGEQAALAIDNAHLYAEATRRADRLRELAELERVVAGSLDADVVLQCIADATARLLGAPVVHLWSAEPGARVLELRASAIARDLPAVPMPTSFAFGDGISGVAAERCELVYVADARADARVRVVEWHREAGLGSILAVPMVAGDTLIGVLTVRARLGELAAVEDQALVTSLAARAALAIQNARAYSDAVRRASHLGALATLSQSITVSLDTAVLMDRIVRTAAAMRPGALAATHVYDAETDTLRYAGCSSDMLRELPDVRDAHQGLPGLVFEQRAPVVVAQPLAHPRTSAPEWWRDRPQASYFGVPILVGETFVGVLDYIAPDGIPDPEEQETLRLLAAQAGIAIRNAALYQAERAEAERASTLAAVAQRITRALELDELLAMIAESATALTGVRFASFWLADEERRTLTLRRTPTIGAPAAISRDRVSYGQGMVGQVGRTREPVVIDDVFAAADIVLDPDWWRSCGFTSFAGYPIMAADELLAVLVLIDDHPLRFSREVTGTLDVERIAYLVARGVVELLEGHGSLVFRYEAEARTLHAIGFFGEDASAVKGIVLQPGEGAAGLAVAERRIVSTSDILNEPGFHLTPELRDRIQTRLYRSVLCVPLVARDRVVGALAMGAEAGRVFTREERLVLQAFADQAALAMENAQLYGSARDNLARLRETQAQLLQAGKMSALGQLVSGVAHELNNPLSVIIGYGQLMLHREIPEALRRPVELMVTQGDRMAKIVRNLLYFARQRPPERVAIKIHQVIEQTLALRQNQLTLSGITVERDFAEELPTVIGDGQQLQQVFLNLILNAEQAIAAEHRGGRIRFHTKVVDHWVRTEVTDDGPGIPPEVLPRIFEPFFTTKEVGAGTGLGLSVSYGIVEEHGGRLSAGSERGRTTFTLDLPIGVAPAPESREIVVMPAFSGKGRRVLVVEDEPGVAELVVTLLREHDWKVDLATGGRVALERARRQRYDLVVSDIRMADGSGEEFYRAVVTENPALAARFVFVTGDTANSAAWAFLKSADVTVLEKPFRPEVFLDLVRRAVSGLTASGSRA
ncbi:MAG: hypothetical protein DME08_25870 [Candidatus Rokuibacteriota bacterium]|nr:MAG: hypothetical protein DME08_25870 [Candidatus Rokubacteria bacterium]